MARDNFTEKTKLLAYQRVAGRCSNPECRVPTSGPAAEYTVSNVGVGAHIHAASPGGPRFLQSMTFHDRTHFSNIIWLCQICATKIDRDPARYHAKLLNEWKALAEERARLEQGRRLPDEVDIYTTVAMALGNTTASFIPKAVGNLHTAISRQLQALDPRFTISSNYINGATRIYAQANEDVAITINVDCRSRNAWQAGLQGLIDFGRSIPLPLDGVVFSGSELIATLAPIFENGSVTIGPVSRPARFKIWCQNMDPPVLEQIEGRFNFGRQQCRFEGLIYGGLVKIEVLFPIEHGVPIDCRLSLTAIVSTWDGADATNPPYLEDFINLIDGLMRPENDFNYSFDLNGERIGSGKINKPESLIELSDALTFAFYIRHAKTLLRHLGKNAFIDTSTGFSAEEHRALGSAIDTFEGRDVYDLSQITGPAEMSIHCNDDGGVLMSMIDTAGYLILKKTTPGQKIKIYNTHYTLPHKSTYYEPVKLHLINKKKQQSGTDFRVEIEMSNEFTCKSIFEQTGDDVLDAEGEMFIATRG